MILLLQLRLFFFPAYRLVSLARERVLGRWLVALLQVVWCGVVWGLAQQLSVLRENLAGLPQRPSASYLSRQFSYSAPKIRTMTTNQHQQTNDGSVPHINMFHSIKHVLPYHDSSK